MGRAPYFPDLSVGETAAPSLARRMRRGQYSPADKSEQRPSRESRPPARRAYAPEGTGRKDPMPFLSWGIYSLLHAYEIDDRHLGRGQEAYGRSPGPGTPAHIEIGSFTEVIKAGVSGMGESGYEAERKNLALVDMS